jgi:uncharacterized protein
MRAILLAVFVVFGLTNCRSVDFQIGYGAYQHGDYTTAFRTWLPLANQGLAEAQYNIGLMYYEGQGVKQDYAEAVRWYHKAGDQGYSEAQHNLGVMYRDGQGVSRNDAEAVRWFSKAADQGVAEAQANLGGLYASGTGVPQNDAQAVMWYRKAADQGVAEAQANLGFMYGKGRGVAQDYAEAVKWYRKAANQGLAEAQLRLGASFAGGLGVPENPIDAVKWTRKAADQGLAKAQSFLGSRYFIGLGVPENPIEAVRWFRKAADQGNAQALFFLGVMYAEGKGVPQDYAEAVKWYRKAANQGFGKDNAKEQKLLAALEEELAKRKPDNTGERVDNRTHDLVMAVQKRLEHLGFHPGSPDGMIGTKTRIAIKAFQRHVGLRVTGEPSDALLTRLNREVDEKVARVTAAPPKPKPSPPPAPEVSPSIDFGRYHALVVGNNGYRSLPRLKTAKNDAKAVATILKEEYGFSVTLLTDSTHDQLLTALHTQRQRLTERDNLLIYYAGHGILDEAGDEGYWLPIDAAQNNPVNWVSNASITTTLKAMKAKHILVVADSCFSGTLARGVRVQTGTTADLERVVVKRSRSVMASGGLEPVEDGSEKHSVFAKGFLDILRDNAGVIDATEVFKKVHHAVRLNADQTPVYADIRKAGHEPGGDFLFVRRK